VPVSMDEMIYHTRCVARGNRSAWVVGDLPFGSYQESREQALRSSIALMQAGAQTLRQHAKALAQAGAAMMVLELMPSQVARDVQADNPGVMTIGIGAGQGTAGQVLVLHDMLNVTRGKLPRFVRNFMAEGGSVDDAVRRYVAAVKDGSFPDEAIHAY